MVKIFNYIERKSFIHSLTGASKLAFMFLFVFASMLTFYTPYLFILTIIAIIVLIMSNIKFYEIKAVIYFTLIFLFLNNFFIYIFAPKYGVEIFGTSHEIFRFNDRYNITLEQLLYHLNIVLKYTSTIPIIVIFISSTKPNEFAASLNKIGVNYKIAYSVSIALRYIPDISSEFNDIKNAMSARGVELSKKERLFKRLKKTVKIIFPLILSSMDRIDVISNAMELRSFGKEKTRTWYSEVPFRVSDYVVVVLGLAVLFISIYLNYANGSRFYNPF